MPSYSVSLNTIAEDFTGTSPDPWARWLRGWTSEENRHGDLLNAFIRLTGRVDMRQVEVMVHHLINNGFDPRVFPDLYAGLVYTSFQERATEISHNNVGRLAAAEGNEALTAICGGSPATRRGTSRSTPAPWPPCSSRTPKAASSPAAPCCAR